MSELSDTRTVVTLVNLNPSQPRTVIVQGGGYGEHQLLSVTAGGKTTPIDAPLLTVQLGPGCGQQLVAGDEAIRQCADGETSVAPRRVVAQPRA